MRDDLKSVFLLKKKMMMKQESESQSSSHPTPGMTSTVEAVPGQNGVPQIHS